MRPMASDCKNGGSSQYLSGPYQATYLWNSIIDAFQTSMPVGRRRHLLRSYDDCFVAVDAVTWLHRHLQRHPSFGLGVTRLQTVRLLQKLHSNHVFEDVRGIKYDRDSFTDSSSRLYRFCNYSNNDQNEAADDTRVFNPLAARLEPKPGTFQKDGNRSILTAHSPHFSSAATTSSYHCQPPLLRATNSRMELGSAASNKTFLAGNCYRSYALNDDVENIPPQNGKSETLPLVTREKRALKTINTSTPCSVAKKSWKSNGSDTPYTSEKHNVNVSTPGSSSGKQQKSVNGARQPEIKDSCKEPKPCRKVSSSKKSKSPGAGGLKQQKTVTFSDTNLATLKPVDSEWNCLEDKAVRVKCSVTTTSDDVPASLTNVSKWTDDKWSANQCTVDWVAGQVSSDSQVSELEMRSIYHHLFNTSLCSLLQVSSLENRFAVESEVVSNLIHNMTFIGKNGIVSNISKKDQLPMWLIDAMRCLAYWPEQVVESIPDYPNFARDVFKVIRDYFSNLDEPLFPLSLGPTVITTVQLLLKSFDCDDIYKICPTDCSDEIHRTSPPVNPHFHLTAQQDAISCYPPLPSLPPTNRLATQAAGLLPNQCPVVNWDTHPDGFDLRSRTCDLKADSIVSNDPARHHSTWIADPGCSPHPQPLSADISSIPACMETSFGLEMESPRTHVTILEDTSIDRQPVPGLFDAIPCHRTSTWIHLPPPTAGAADRGLFSAGPCFGSVSDVSDITEFGRWKDDLLVDFPALNTDTRRLSQSCTHLVIESLPEKRSAVAVDDVRQLSYCKATSINDVYTASESNGAIRPLAPPSYESLYSTRTDARNVQRSQSLFPERTVEAGIHSLPHVANGHRVGIARGNSCFSRARCSYRRAVDANFSYSTPPGKSLFTSSHPPPPHMDRIVESVDDCERHLVNAVQHCCLLLPPARRRMLQLVLRFLSKIASNQKLTLSEEMSNRRLVIESFSKFVLAPVERSPIATHFVDVVVGFMIDRHSEVTHVPRQLQTDVENTLATVRSTKMQQAERWKASDVGRPAIDDKAGKNSKPVRQRSRTASLLRKPLERLKSLRL